ncbi:hypothetical protein GMMP15_660025 [Candidatus Magnetomoraceae bacterium gMMP-15]
MGLELKIGNENNALAELIRQMMEKQEIVKKESIKRKTLEKMEEIDKNMYIQLSIKTELKIADEMFGLTKAQKKEGP